ncbi:glycoside hydrolase family 92 protein [Sphingomonas aerolata]|uniref:glycoside hydrolase domain-containing protein n=1 Tax=Sphingomonas aerolata TaxID=185951 RepID=UPI002FE37004
MPLLALLQPDRSPDIAASLVALHAGGKPQWSTRDEPFLTVRTEHAGIALLDLHRKGIAFDTDAALAGMVADSATLKRGTPDEQIEAAYDDWATAELHAISAAPISRRASPQRRCPTAQSWRSVFQSPGADGDVVKARGLYRVRCGNIAGRRSSISAGSPRRSGARAAGRTPDLLRAGPVQHDERARHPRPWMFAALGEPRPTADLVRTILTRPIAHPYTNSGKLAVPFVGRSFALAPQGFADGMDDDAGGMTAWYVFAALGLYPLVPGEPWYVPTTPAFEQVRLDLGKGRVLLIRRDGPADGVVQRVTLDGRALSQTRIDHADLMRGGTLVVTTQAPRSQNVPQLQDSRARVAVNGMLHPDNAAAAPTATARMLGYASGNFGKNLLASTMDVFLMFTLTEYWGISPLAAGLIVMLGLVWDGLCNRCSAASSTAPPTARGLYRRLLVIAAPVVTILFTILFLLPTPTAAS